MARKAVETKRFTGWRVYVDGRRMGYLPASAAGVTEETALEKARIIWPGRDVRVEGVR
jgi:hypothetical protein